MQSPLFAALGGTTPPPRYLIDTSSVMWLDGENTDKQGHRMFSLEEEEIVWAALSGLAVAGCLKSIRAVREELEREDPVGHRRVMGLGKKSMAAAPTVAVYRAYRSITRQFPVVKSHWDRDPADPWLIAYAEIYGFTVICDETPASAKAGKAAKKIYVPDMCSGRVPPVTCVGLRALAVALAWLPPD